MGSPGQSVDFGFPISLLRRRSALRDIFLSLIPTASLQKVKLNVPKKINLNFVGGMTIEQTFDRAPDGTRIITKDDIINGLKSTENKGMYARRLNIYSNQAFEGRPDDPKIFEESAPIIIPMEAYRRSADFWEENRPTEAGTRKQNNVELSTAKPRSVYFLRRDGRRLSDHLLVI